VNDSSRKSDDLSRLRTPSHAAPTAVEPIRAQAPVSVALSATIVVGLMALLKLAVGLLIGSVALLSEGLHTLIDLFAAAISYFTVRAAGEPADAEHRYGHGKIENVAGIAQAAFIFVPTLVIVYRAVLGLVNLDLVLAGGGVGIGTIVMAITIVVNILLAARLLSVARAYRSEAVRAAGYHQLNDLYTSIGVTVALGLIWWKPEWKILDPLVALCVTAVSTWMAWLLFRDSMRNLLDTSAGPETDRAVIAAIEKYKPVVRGYHNLRTRRAGSAIYVDVHVELCGEMSFQEAHEITERIERTVSESLQGSDVIIHADPCLEDCEECDVAPTVGGEGHRSD
jgi:cation diffusion facilitator family transporter